MGVAATTLSALWMSAVIATGGQRRAFELLSSKSGLFAMPGAEALRAEMTENGQKMAGKMVNTFA